jgi:hypothetical protein
MVKLNLRTKSLGTRVSEDEYAHLERVAQKASKTLAEWCREVMLNSANGGAADTAVAGARAEALMAEVVALRFSSRTLAENSRRSHRADTDEVEECPLHAQVSERLMQAFEDSICPARRRDCCCFSGISPSYKRVEVTVTGVALYAPKPTQDIHGENGDARAGGNTGQRLFCGGFAVREAVASDNDCDQTRNFRNGASEKVLDSGKTVKPVSNGEPCASADTNRAQGVIVRNSLLGTRDSGPKRQPLIYGPRRLGRRTRAVGHLSCRRGHDHE